MDRLDRFNFPGPQTPEEWAEARNVLRQLKEDDRVKNTEAREAIDYLRPEVLAFAQAIEQAMRNNDPRKGDSWKKDCTQYFLMEKLLEETEEADTAFENVVYTDFKLGKEHFCEELADVGAVAMMLWNRVKDD